MHDAILKHNAVHRGYYMALQRYTISLQVLKMRNWVQMSILLLLVVTALSFNLKV